MLNDVNFYLLWSRLKKKVFQNFCMGNQILLSINRKEELTSAGHPCPPPENLKDILL